MTTRADIPSRGTGPILATYYVVNLATGDYLPVSTPDALHDDVIKLVAVPPDVDPEGVGDYLVATDLLDAPSVADVVEFARRQQLYSTRTVSPEVAAALEAVRRDAEARADA